MKLHLDVFEGPLDLLLYLIKKNNLEISRISIANVTKQYLQYLEAMKELNIDMVSDFLLMAAELAHIKSKTILPAEEKEETKEDDEDSADQLVAKLRLYQHYKNLAEALQKRVVLNRDVFKQNSLELGAGEEDVEEKKEPKEVKETVFEVNSYDLVKAFHEVLARLPKKKREHHVVAERVSVTERIYEVLDELRKVDHVLFTDLFQGHEEKIEYVVTFLAILEMGKLRMVQVYQTETYGPIRLKRRIEEDTAEEQTSEPIEESVTFK